MSLDEARTLRREGRVAEALALAWKAYDEAPQGRAETSLVAHLLRDDPELLTAARAPSLRGLLVDPAVDPTAVSAAGWRHLLRDTELFAPGRDAETIAMELEANPLALTLLREDYVALETVERVLTRVRRHLLLAGRAADLPQLAGALIAQASLNGGAWLFEADERALLSTAGDFAFAYLPSRPSALKATAFGDAVTRAVAAQYEGWPYPQWRRVTAAPPRTMADAVRARDPDGPDTIAVPAEILIAGCGTGRQTAMTAFRYPGDRITSIDISQASLAYAKERCDAAGLTGIDFRLLDLHEVETLNRRFDAVLTTGVLHHLPDPEKGWEALTRVLKPGGVMHVMVYSRLARMRIQAWRKALGELANGAVDDDKLREARRRLMALPHKARPKSADFHTLAGVHDLILHRHEDPFDIPRIRRALDRLGLTLIRFDFQDVNSERTYRQINPSDNLRRDFDGWMAMERGNPVLFVSMYDFWCRKPAA